MARKNKRNNGAGGKKQGNKNGGNKVQPKKLDPAVKESPIEQLADLTYNPEEVEMGVKKMNTQQRKMLERSMKVERIPPKDKQRPTQFTVLDVKSDVKPGENPNASTVKQVGTGDKRQPNPSKNEVAGKPKNSPPKKEVVTRETSKSGVPKKAVGAERKLKENPPKQAVVTGINPKSIPPKNIVVVDTPKLISSNKNGNEGEEASVSEEDPTLEGNKRNLRDFIDKQLQDADDVVEKGGGKLGNLWLDTFIYTFNEVLKDAESSGMEMNEEPADHMKKEIKYEEILEKLTENMNSLLERERVQKRNSEKGHQLESEQSSKMTVESTKHVSLPTNQNQVLVQNEIRSTKADVNAFNHFHFNMENRLGRPSDAEQSRKILAVGKEGGDGLDQTQAYQKGTESVGNIDQVSGGVLQTDHWNFLNMTKPEGSVPCPGFNIDSSKAMFDNVMKAEDAVNKMNAEHPWTTDQSPKCKKVDQSNKFDQDVKSSKETSDEPSPTRSSEVIYESNKTNDEVVKHTVDQEIGSDVLGLNPDVESVAAVRDTDSEDSGESEADDSYDVWSDEKDSPMLQHQRFMLHLCTTKLAEALKLRGTTKGVETGRLRAFISYMRDRIHFYNDGISERRRLRQDKHKEMITNMLLRQNNEIEKGQKTYQEIKELNEDILVQTLEAFRERLMKPMDIKLDDIKGYKQFVDKQEELRKLMEQFNDQLQKIKDVSQMCLQLSERHEEIRQFHKKGMDWVKEQKVKFEKAVKKLEEIGKKAMPRLTIK